MNGERWFLSRNYFNRVRKYFAIKREWDTYLILSCLLCKYSLNQFYYFSFLKSFLCFFKKTWTMVDVVKLGNIFRFFTNFAQNHRNYLHDYWEFIGRIASRLWYKTWFLPQCRAILYMYRCSQSVHQDFLNLTVCNWRHHLSSMLLSLFSPERTKLR